jgi:long-chain fatty acid transport protein
MNRSSLHSVRKVFSVARTPFTASLLICGSVLHASNAEAAGFALLEQSASRLGTAFAGTAAAADDVTTLFFNPAGLTRLEGTHASVIASAIEITSEFHTDPASQPAYGQPLGSNGGDAGDWNYVPSAYFSTRLNEDVAVGIGINAPFGLKLEYARDWAGRFQALNSEIRTINVNPSIAYRINDRVSIGGGLNYQRIDAELTNAVNYSAVVRQALGLQLLNGQLTLEEFTQLANANLGLEGHARVRGDDTAWSFNIGLLFQMSETTRLGFAYRSSVDYTVEGSARFDPPTASNPVGTMVINALGAPGAPLSSGRARVDLELPDSAILSLHQMVGANIELLADVAWTGWSSVQQLVVTRDTGGVVSETPELWDDTWRFSLGGTYRMSEQLKLRAGIAYDETPVPDSTRTPRLPDGDRTWIAIGVQWVASGAWTIDAGYAHLFSEDVRLNQDANNASLNGHLIGEQTSDVDVVSVQASYRF